MNDFQFLLLSIALAGLFSIVVITLMKMTKNKNGSSFF